MLTILACITAIDKIKINITTRLKIRIRLFECDTNQEKNRKKEN